MDALPALTVIGAEAIRSRSATHAAPARVPGRLLYRMREWLADVLDRASHTVAPARPPGAPNAPTLASWQG